MIIGMRDRGGNMGERRGKEIERGSRKGKRKTEGEQR